MTQFVATNTDVSAVCMKCGQPFDAHRPIVSCPPTFKPGDEANCGFCGNTGPIAQHAHCAQAFDRGRAARTDAGSAADPGTAPKEE